MHASPKQLAGLKAVGDIHPIRQVALKAVRADGSALMFVSDELKRDKDQTV